MPNSLPRPWTRARRCKVCGKAGCLVSNPSDPAAVVCRNSKSAVAIGTVGWLHELTKNGPTWAPWRRSLARLVKQDEAKDRKSGR